MHVTWDSAAAEKGGFEHFMMKEIHEEPRAVRDTILPHIRNGAIRFDEIDLDALLDGDRPDPRRRLRHGLHAGMVGKYLIEKLRASRLKLILRPSSAIATRSSRPTLVIIISQSGETLDTLAAMREAKRRGGRILAIVNVVGSSIAREADSVIYTMAGPKSPSPRPRPTIPSWQPSAAGRGIRPPLRQDGSMKPPTAGIHQLEKLPELLEQETLAAKDSVQRVAAEHFNARSIFFIGRGIDYVLAMEASLKLKEISYIHSEAYPAASSSMAPSP
jgi:glutamine---fructose-6-phosphate transaminase (isomerizing)